MTLNPPSSAPAAPIDAASVDTAITIRTILYHKDRYWVQAGAGIVADSVPRREYEETRNKAMGMLQAIQGAEQT